MRAFGWNAAENASRVALGCDLWRGQAWRRGYGLCSAGEQVSAEGAEAERRQGGDGYRGAQGRGDGVFLQSDLYHCGGDAELGRGDESRGQWLARGQGRGGVDDEIENDERGSHQQQIGVVEQRAKVQSGAKHDEEERDKEAFCDAADLSRQTLRSSDRGHDEPNAKSGQEHAGAALLRDPSQTKEHGQRETQVERPTALVGALT